jgi:hypothetical protein
MSLLPVIVGAGGLWVAWKAKILPWPSESAQNDGITGDTVEIQNTITLSNSVPPPMPDYNRLLGKKHPVRKKGT